MTGDNFQGMFGDLSGDTGEFDSKTSKINSQVNSIFSKLNIALSGTGAAFKSTSDQIVILKAVESALRVERAKSITVLADQIRQQQDFIKQMELSRDQFEDYETALKKVSVAIKGEVEPQIKKMREAHSKGATVTAASAAKFVTSIEAMSNEMVSSAQSIPGLVKYWLSDLPKKAGEPFKKVGEFFTNWAKRSDEKAKLKETEREYKKLLNNIKSAQRKATMDVRKSVGEGSAAMKSFTTASRGFVTAIQRIVRAIKSIPGGIGGAARGIATKVGSFFSGASGAMMMVGSLVSLIGNALSEAINLALKRAEIAMQSYYSTSDMGSKQGTASISYQKLAGKGGVVPKEIGGSWSKLWGEIGNGVAVSRNIVIESTNDLVKSSSILTGSMKTVGNVFIAGGKEAKAFSQNLQKIYERMGPEMISMQKTLFAESDFMAFVTDVAGKSGKQGAELFKEFNKTFERMTSNGMNTIDSLAHTAERFGISVPSAVKGMTELTETVNTVGASFEDASALMSGVIAQIPKMQGKGFDLRKDFGKISNELGGLYKKMERGSRAFFGMMGTGQKDPFTAMAAMRSGGGNALRGMLGGMINMGSGLKSSNPAATEELRTMFYESQGLSEDTARLLAVSGKAILESPEQMKQIAKEMKDRNNPQQALLSHAARQSEIQQAMLTIQEAMNKVQIILAKAAVNFFAASITVLQVMANNITALLGLFAGYLAGQSGNKYAQLGGAVLGGLGGAKIIYDLANSDSLKAGVTDMVKELLRVPGAMKSAFKVAEQQMGKVAKLTGAGLSKDGKELVTAVQTQMKRVSGGDKKHFGGALQKFHFGGIIKTGNEALLMSPNPTSVLSPADTRQAVRGGGKSQVINVNFSGPVYGIPKFEEMIKKMVLKAATAR